MRRVTATEAARNFSDVLDRVAVGEEIEVTRDGAAVAIIRPAEAQVITAERFRSLVASAPRPDDGLADDLRALRASVGGAAR